MDGDALRRLKDAYPQFSLELIEEVHRFKGVRAAQYLAMLAHSAEDSRPKSPSTPPSSLRESTTFYSCDASQSTPSRTSEAPSDGSDEIGTSPKGKTENTKHSVKDVRGSPVGTNDHEDAPRSVSDPNTLETEQSASVTEEVSSRSSKEAVASSGASTVKKDLSDVDDGLNDSGRSKLHTPGGDLLDSLRSDGGNDVNSTMAHWNAQQSEDRSSITKSNENGKESIELLLGLTSLERDFAMLQIGGGNDRRQDESDLSVAEAISVRHAEDQVEEETGEADDACRWKLCHRRSRSCDAQLGCPITESEEQSDKDSEKRLKGGRKCDSDHGGVPSGNGVSQHLLQEHGLNTELPLFTTTRTETAKDDAEEPLDSSTVSDCVDRSSACTDAEDDSRRYEPSEDPFLTETTAEVSQESAEKTEGKSKSLDKQAVGCSGPDLDYLLFLENTMRVYHLNRNSGQMGDPSASSLANLERQSSSELNYPPGFESDGPFLNEDEDASATASAGNQLHSTHQTDPVDESGATEKDGGAHEVASSEQAQLTRYAAVEALRWKSVHQMCMNRAREFLSDFEASTPEKELKVVDKVLRLKVTQVAGSRRKILHQTTELLQLLQQQKTQSEKVFFCSRLARLIVTRCSNLNEILAMAVSHVVRNLIAECPELLRLIMFHLHQMSPLLVPMYCTYNELSIQGRELYEKEMKFAPVTGASMAQMETMDQYLGRQAGLAYFHAGLIAIASENDMYGAEAGWSYLARFLNEIPADRITVAFLFYFLKIAGYSLHQRFKNQFLKLLRFAEQKFVLSASLADNPQILPAVSRLRTYISTEAYLEVPESLTMPTTEDSLLIHA